MFLLYKSFEKEFLTLFLSVGLLAWGMTATVHSFLKEDKTILLQMNDFQTEVIDGKVHIPSEIENFLNHFVGIFYSYTSQNYERHIDASMYLMTEDLALKFAPKLNKMFDKVKKKRTFQSAMITKMTLIKENEYEIHMNVIRREGEEAESEDKYRLRVEIEKIKRNLKNPFGLVVSGLEENYE